LEEGELQGYSCLKMMEKNQDAVVYPRGPGILDVQEFRDVAGRSRESLVLFSE
jgi:hypothetical protein